MMKPLKIILPTDFSENAWKAIVFALEMLHERECNFIILHAHQAAPSGWVSTVNKEHDTRLHNITKLEVQDKVDKIVKRLQQINKTEGHQFEGVVVSDSLLNAIGIQIIDRDADYVFMGTQGASGIREVFLGSNTVDLIKNIRFCPIVVVPSNMKDRKLSEIVFATDYRHPFLKVELDPLRELADICRAHLRIVYVGEEESLDDQQKTEQVKLKDFLEGTDLTIEALGQHPSVAQRLEQLTKDEEVGLLAMIHSHHSFFSRMMREPVIKKVAFHVQVPFLVLPEVS